MSDINEWLPTPKSYKKKSIGKIEKKRKVDMTFDEDYNESQMSIPTAWRNYLSGPDDVPVYSLNSDSVIKDQTRRLTGQASPLTQRMRVIEENSQEGEEEEEEDEDEPLTPVKRRKGERVGGIMKGPITPEKSKIPSWVVEIPSSSPQLSPLKIKCGVVGDELPSPTPKGRVRFSLDENEERSEEGQPEVQPEVEVRSSVPPESFDSVPSSQCHENEYLEEVVSEHEERINATTEVKSSPPSKGFFSDDEVNEFETQPSVCASISSDDNAYETAIESENCNDTDIEEGDKPRSQSVIRSFDEPPAISTRHIYSLRDILTDSVIDSLPVSSAQKQLYRTLFSEAESRL